MRLYILASLLASSLTLYADPNNGRNIQVQVERLPIESDLQGYEGPTPYVNYQERPETAPGSRPMIRANVSSPNRPADQPYNGAVQQPMPPSSTQNVPRKQVELTLSIIKPDAVQANHIGDIISRFEQSGLRIAGMKMVNLTPEQAGSFYRAHRDRPFYPGLVDFMSSGPVVILALEGENAVAKNRQLMGATDPKKAERGTIRADYATDVGRNAVHGSDSPEAAQQEIFFFFEPNEITRRP